MLSYTHWLLKIPNPRFRENVESPVTSDNEWTSGINTRTICRKGLILPPARKRFVTTSYLKVPLQSTMKYFNIPYIWKRNFWCVEATSLNPVKKQPLPPYKHSRQRLKKGRARPSSGPEDRDLFLYRSSRSRTDSRLNFPRLRLDHLQVGDDVIDKHCVALDSRVQFKLYTGIRAGLT